MHDNKTTKITFFECIMTDLFTYFTSMFSSFVFVPFFGTGAPQRRRRRGERCARAASRLWPRREYVRALDAGEDAGRSRVRTRLPRPRPHLMLGGARGGRGDTVRVHDIQRPHVPSAAAEQGRATERAEDEGRRESERFRAL